MKFLIDSLVTSAPSTCSSTIQMYTFVARMLEKYDDVYFYWMVPKWVTDEQMEWFQKSDRIKYIRVAAHKDRMNEYISFNQEIMDCISFYGDYWDWDVLLTNRAGIVPLYKLWAVSPRQNDHTWVKEVWLIENMPLMSFKPMVATIDASVQDAFTLNGHRAADRVMIMSYHEKSQMLKRAKDFFLPLEVVDLDHKIKEVVSSQLETMMLKSEKYWYEDGKRFKCAYIGRMASAGTNLESVYGSMLKHWVWSGADNIEVNVLTVTKNPKKVPPSQFHLKHLPREKFWHTLKTDLHVGMALHEDAGFLLSLMEPLFFGTPMIVMDRAWSRGQLGNEYPFYVKNEQDCYSLLRRFYLDYPAMYKKFEKYCTEWLWPTYKKIFKEDLMYMVMEDYMLEFKDRKRETWLKYESRSKNEMVLDLMTFGGDEFVVEDVIHKMGDKGLTRSMSQKLKRRHEGVVGLVWATAMIDYTDILQYFYGYEHASIEVGHMKRVVNDKEDL